MQVSMTALVEICAECRITQYSSTVYIGIAMVYPHLKTIQVHFHFQFQVDIYDIKVKNV